MNSPFPEEWTQPKYRFNDKVYPAFNNNRPGGVTGMNYDIEGKRWFYHVREGGNVSHYFEDQLSKRPYDADDARASMPEIPLFVSMVCHICEHNNAQGDHYCDNCGADLTVQLSQCAEDRIFAAFGVPASALFGDKDTQWPNRYFSI